MQPIYNSNRRSVENLSSDFVVWSTLSPLFIIIHIAILRWDPVARAQYALRYPADPVPQTQFISPEGFAPNQTPGASIIELLIYLHAFVIWGWVVLRSQMHKKYSHTINLNNQEFSLLSQFLLGVVLLMVGLVWLCSVFGVWGFKWLDVGYMVYGFGELMAWFRFVPQIPINFLAMTTLGMAPSLMYTEALGLVFLWISQLTKVHKYDRWMQLALPNSVFFLLVFKTLVFSQLFYQMWFAYRKNNILKLASLPQPVTAEGRTVDQKSQSFMSDPAAYLASTLNGGLEFARRLRGDVFNKSTKSRGEAGERLLDENEMTVFSRDNSKDS